MQFRKLLLNNSIVVCCIRSSISTGPEKQTAIVWTENAILFVWIFIVQYFRLKISLVFLTATAWPCPVYRGQRKQRLDRRNRMNGKNRRQNSNGRQNFARITENNLASEVAKLLTSRGQIDAKHFFYILYLYAHIQTSMYFDSPTELANESRFFD